jgi:hypothetical protein
MLKIENMTFLTRAAWRTASMNMSNWTMNEETGQKDIGISRKVRNFDVVAPPPSASKADDVQETPSWLKSQEQY